MPSPRHLSFEKYHVKFTNLVGFLLPQSKSPCIPRKRVPYCIKKGSLNSELKIARFMIAFSDMIRNEKDVF